MAANPIHAISERLTNNSTHTDSNILPYTHGLAGVSLGLDKRLITWLWLSMLGLGLLILAVRIWQLIQSHLRRIYSMSAGRTQQNYWSYDSSSYWPLLKKHLLYAPLGNKRHNREIQLSAATNYGTIPSRLHSVLLMLYVFSNIIYCCLLDYRNTDKAALLAEVRGRTGILATANMIPLVLLAGRNNPAIASLKVSFDTFNLFHRWIGRIVIVEAVAHTIAWGSNSVQAVGLHNAITSIGGNHFLEMGGLAVVCMVVILFQSLSPVRHALYEVFLHLHQLMAFLAVLGVYIHLELAKLPALPYIRAVVFIWAGDRVVRMLRLLYLNFSRRNGRTKVHVEALSGEACRVTFQLPRHITVCPGSHVYAYLPKVSWWMSHPFSVAWTNVESEPPTGLPHSIPPTPPSGGSLEKQFPCELPPRDLSNAPTSVSLITVARAGMTRKLYDLAASSPQKSIEMTGYIEGPYAGHDSLASYGTVLLFAGGAGITHHLIQIRHLIACANACTVATRQIVLVWSIKDVTQMTWVRPWMDEILRMEGRRDILKMLIYVSRAKKENLLDPTTSVKLIAGRCDPGIVLDEILPTRVGASVVSVCGPGAFADSVRLAVRQRLGVGVLDFVEEAFTW